MNIHAFVISWKGKHRKASAIASALSGAVERLSIVYSDPEDDQPDAEWGTLVRRSDALFWADKFQACLKECDDASLMLVIHADCECADWRALVMRCRVAFETVGNIGVWTPRTTGTPWRLQRTGMGRLPGGPYHRVAQTDGLVFALSPRLLPRMRRAEYSRNLFGLGIDWMFVCAAYASGLVAIADESAMVRHWISRGYSVPESRLQMRDFLAQLTDEERKVHEHLVAHMRPAKRLSNLLYRAEYQRQRLNKLVRRVFWAAA